MHACVCVCVRVCVWKGRGVGAEYCTQPATLRLRERDGDIGGRFLTLVGTWVACFKWHACCVCSLVQLASRLANPKEVYRRRYVPCGCRAAACLPCVRPAAVVVTEVFAATDVVPACTCPAPTA